MYAGSTLVSFPAIGSKHHRAWVFSDHTDCLSGPCPAIGVRLRLRLSTAPEEEEEPSCGGMVMEGS
jgi:hypothetical protein